MSKFVIIGGGAAGIKAAEKIRELTPQAEITIVMQDESVHSRCMLHKFLAGERDEKTLSFIKDSWETDNNVKIL